MGPRGITLPEAPIRWFLTMRDYTGRHDADLGGPLDPVDYAVVQKLADEALAKIRGNLNHRRLDLHNAAATHRAPRRTPRSATLRSSTTVLAGLKFTVRSGAKRVTWRPLLLSNGKKIEAPRSATTTPKPPGSRPVPASTPSKHQPGFALGREAQQIGAAKAHRNFHFGDVVFS
jgi:hypothetical protein